MEPDCQWNVFVPQQMWSEPPGYLSGYVDSDNGLVYIHGISDTSPEPHGVKVIGYWQDTYGISISPEKIQSETWVSIKVVEGKPLCMLFALGTNGSLEQKPSVCITFNPDEVMESYILNRPSTKDDLKGSKDGDVTCITKNVINSMNSKTDLKSGLELQKSTSIPVRQRHQDFLVSLEEMLSTHYSKLSLPKCVKLFSTAPKKHSQSQPQTHICVPLFLVWIFSVLEKIVKTGLQGIRICCTPLPKILHTPCTFQYLQDKIDRCKQCLQLDKSKNLNIF
ncbi:hypothetical protein EGW08_008544, partial [Elysia chlorotica]